MKTSWIIYFMAVGFGLYETAYFGWNWVPSSPSEVICDGITAVLFALALRRAKGEVPVGRRVRPQPQRSANMAKKKFYVVLNPAKNEGYVTDDKADALFASENIRPAGGNSLIAEALREAYVEADEEAALPMIEMELEV